MPKAKPLKWRLRIYISPPLVHKVKLAAARDELSVSSYCRKLIARAVARVESRP
jgi:predicted HicB family RNase H-like nuclease